MRANKKGRINTDSPARINKTIRKNEASRWCEVVIMVNLVSLKIGKLLATLQTQRRTFFLYSK